MATARVMSMAMAAAAAVAKAMVEGQGKALLMTAMRVMTVVLRAPAFATTAAGQCMCQLKR
jgi:hypothetical protein